MDSTPLLYWVRERENIRLKRAAGFPVPWTTDPILATYRFCNVRRRDDRVSQWIIHNIIEPYDDHSNLWVMLALARYVNWTPTLQEIMDAGLWPTSDWPHWDEIGAVIDARTLRGDQAWTGAYMIRAESNPNASWYKWGKGRYVCERVIGEELWSSRREIELALCFNSVHTAHSAICGRYGWGSFMAGQLVADLTYSSVLCGARDLTTWAPLGPGSTRGLNRLAGRPLKQTISQEQAVEEMQQLYFDVLVELGAEFRDMTLHDLQNCLCEVDKYLRALNGEGKPRSHFVPHHN